MIFKSFEIKKNIKNILKYNFFLLYGENEGLKKDIKEEIKVALKNKDDGMEYNTLYEDEILNNEENFYESIYSGSLFGSGKIITINNASDKIIDQIETVYNKYPENVFFIIFSEILEKKSKIRNFFEKNEKTVCVPCYLDSDKDLQFVIRNEAFKNNLSLSGEITNLLIEKSNGDRNNIKKEIEKIKSFSLNNKKLEIDDIKSIINFSGEYKTDTFINECLCGNTTQYKKILSEFYSGAINQVYLLRILNNKLQRLLNIKELENKYDNLDNLLNSTKPPIFWKEKPLIKKQLSLWSLKELKNILIEMNNTETLCKKNPQISKVIFYNFFSDVCKKASNYS